MRPYVMLSTQLVGLLRPLPNWGGPANRKQLPNEAQHICDGQVTYLS